MSLRSQSLLVNALTFSRVPFIFAFSVCAVVAELSGSFPLAAAACVLMFVAAISDFFDGMLARRWGVVSRFGKMADPLMDKVFFIVSFPTLLWLACIQGGANFHSILLLAFTVLYILRDQWVTFLRAVASVYGADVGAMWLGKVRTALSFPAAGVIYIYLAFHRQWPAALDQAWLHALYAVEIALVALNVYSSYAYTRAYAAYLRRSISNKENQNA